MISQNHIRICAFVRYLLISQICDINKLTAAIGQVTTLAVCGNSCNASAVLFYNAYLLISQIIY